ncbi:MAG: efflux RND transporter periplasmic adaptor subunit [Gemmataceae bacterium]
MSEDLKQEQATALVERPEHKHPESNGPAWRRAIPTALVMLTLAGLFAFGHHTGWKLPSLQGSGDTSKEEWCDEHGVPEAICVECDPSLYPAPAAPGWCAVHGVHACPLCNPEIAQLEEMPSFTQAERDRVAAALALRPRNENDQSCKLHTRRLQFASIEAANAAHLDVRPAERCSASKLPTMVEALTANGEITYDQNRIAHLSARVPGTVWRVNKRIGDVVKTGEVLALVDAAEVGKAKAEFLHALAHKELKEKLYEGILSAKGSVPARTIQEAEAAVHEAEISLLGARQTLVNLGLPIEDVKLDVPAEKLASRIQFLGLDQATIAELDPGKTTANLLPIKSPLDGLVVNRHVVSGEVIDSQRVLFVVADTSEMWLTLHVRPEDAAFVKLGQPIRFQPDEGGQPVEGKISWISTGIDPKTRTVPVRAELANASGALRDGIFGTGKIILREDPDAIVVPSSAVHSDGKCAIVFVQDKNWQKGDAPKLYYPRSVRVGASNGYYTEILAGLAPDEKVATTGSEMLRSQLLKNKLGEGCCHGHHH